jgi:hypothetical protein
MIYSIINLMLYKRELIVAGWLSTLPQRVQLIHYVNELIHYVSVKGEQNGLLEAVRSYLATRLL